MQNKKYLKGLVLLALPLLVSTSLFAGALPASIPFEDGEQFNLTLSGINFNRVFVEGEKITQLSYPAGAFAVDKSEMESAVSQEGSVYLKPMSDTPLTVFFTTDKGHHFSLSVNVSETFGKTVRMRMKRQTAVRFVKADVVDVSVVDEAMLAMKLGDIPKDFNVVRVKPRPFYVNKDIKVSLEKQYQGATLTGYVYRLENKANHAVKLTTSLFSHKKADMLALSDDTIAPKKVAYLYGLYSNIS